MFKILENYKGEAPKGTRFSLFSAEPRPITLFPQQQQRQLIRTGLEASVPEGYGVLIQGVPGLYQCHGIAVTSSMLTSESFGEVKVVVHNESDEEFIIFPGDRVAEGIVIKLGGEE